RGLPRYALGAAFQRVRGSDARARRGCEYRCVLGVEHSAAEDAALSGTGAPGFSVRDRIIRCAASSKAISSTRGRAGAPAAEHRAAVAQRLGTLQLEQFPQASGL